jgi:hypothetical protein
MEAVEAVFGTLVGACVRNCPSLVTDDERQDWTVEGD